MTDIAPRKLTMADWLELLWSDTKDWPTVGNRRRYSGTSTHMGSTAIAESDNQLFALGQWRGPKDVRSNTIPSTRRQQRETAACARIRWEVAPRASSVAPR